MRCHLWNKTALKTSGKPLTSGRISNPLPSAEQYGTQTVVKSFDEWKYEQVAIIR